MPRGPQVSQEHTTLVTVDHATKRWFNDGRGALPPTPMVGRVAPHGIGDRQRTGYQQPNDGEIRRDQTPHQHVQLYRGAGRTVNDWVHSGPPMPTIWHRAQTVSPRQGGKQRWLQNPAAPGTGLHTYVVLDSSNSIGTPDRFIQQAVSAGGGGIARPTGRRQNRLAPARYSGQSYSQTTTTQGGA